MSNPNQIVIVHKGALGDFLQVWPSLYTLRAYWPEKSFYFHGPQAYQLWTRPLGIKQAPWSAAKAVDALYTVDKWPEALKNTLVIWFGLKKPPTEQGFPDLWFVPGLIPGDYSPPRDIYSHNLAKKGIPWQRDWFQAWQRLIPCPQTDHLFPNKILLFPGAGHPAKRWPIDKYELLANWLQEQGFLTRTILGPIENEKNIFIPGIKSIHPQDFSQLQIELAKATLIVGNDSGPMHLASYMKVKTLTLFGPTSPKQWGPFNGQTLWLDLICSPCSQIAKIDCQNPRCMTEISLDKVKEKINLCLNNSCF